MTSLTMTARPVRPAPGPRKAVVPSGVFGMLLFVAAEMMMFAGLLSAFLVTKASIPGGVWPPPGQPLLPVQATAVNSLALLASGVLLLVARRRFQTTAALAKAPYLAAIVLGTVFVAFQGYEWSQLLAQGLTVESGVHGRFFYLLVGAHALHAIAALGVLTWGHRRLTHGKLTGSELSTIAVLWTFVVGLWPVLYVAVYL